MKSLRLLVLTVLLLASCSTIPVIHPAAPRPEAKFPACPVCPSPFLKTPHRLVHIIEVRVAGKAQGAVIGVTLNHPSAQFVSCAIMTAEGITLFEAEATPGLKIIRALPPFDSRDFARNMIEDIKLIFLAPEGQVAVKGILADGAAICRWQTTSAEFVDVVAGPQETFEITRYAASGRRQRRIKLKHGADNFYQHIELTAQDAFDYSLLMTLVESEPVKSEPQTNNRGLQDNEKNCGR